MTTSPPPQDAALLLNPPDLVATALDVDGLSVRGVSFRGTAHEMFGDPRQDAFALAASDEWVVLIVADGIGSSEHSHHGATAAVEAVAAAIEFGGLNPADGGEVFRVAVDAAREVADALGVPSRSVAATLSVAAVARGAQPTDGRPVIIHTVGDSPALLLEPAEATWTYLTSTEDGPSNIVRTWVPDRAANPRCVETTMPPGSILVVTSDGFTTPLGDGTGDLGADLAVRWGRGPRELFAFVVDLSFNAYHDDKTVVALWNMADQASSSDPSVTEESDGE